MAVGLGAAAVTAPSAGYGLRCHRGWVILVRMRPPYFLTALKTLGLTLALLILGCSERPRATQTSQASSADEASAESSVQKLTAQHLPNAWRLHSKVISGGLPEGTAAFQELKDLGVKTIISVDGAKPDVELAHQFGLKYVHLPHGYDGVPTERARELAKAVKELEGPIYIHCHHGKHRSPTAATVACIGTGLLKPEMGLQILKMAGTGENYRGLYLSAAQAVRFDDALLDALQVEFRESVDLPPIADAMVKIEHCFDHLKQLDKSQWVVESQQPESDPAHMALLLREHYTELLRSNDLSRQPAGFIDLVAACELEAQELEKSMSQWKDQRYARPAPDRVTKGFAAVAASCTSCHKRFRDIPINEK